jgi:hypothetical protein
MPIVDGLCVKLRNCNIATGVANKIESDISQLRTQLTIARNEIHNLRLETVIVTSWYMGKY